MNSYFSHDSNARNDEKLIALRMKHGWEGYGIYWAIIEKLRDATNYRLSTDYSLIAFDLRADTSLIKNIVENFLLFIFEDQQFYSQSLCQRMALKDSKSEKARDAAKTRWDNSQTKPRKSTGTEAGFVPPTPKQVEAYCQELRYTVDVERFINYYQSKNWMIGSSKMKSWKAALRTWDQNNYQKKANNEQPDATARLHPALQ